jgi:hypothetical protein
MSLGESRTEAASVSDVAAKVPTQALGVLTLTCPERPGIVQAVTSFLVKHDLDIVAHHQFDDSIRNHLYMRTAFAARRPGRRPVPHIGVRADGRRFLDGLRLLRRGEASAAGDGVETWSLPQRPNLPLASRDSRRRDCLSDLQPRGPATHGRGRKPTVPPHSGHARHQACSGGSPARAGR